MKNAKKLLLLLLITTLSAFVARSAEKDKSYYMDENGISRQALENYLDRSITMVYFLMPDKPEGNRTYPYHEDDVRMLKETGAKFIGRSIYRWGGESLLNSPEFWTKAKGLIDEMHDYDPEIIFQGCLFEIISKDVDNVKIPSWVFKDFHLPIQDRTFSYQAMLNLDGKMAGHWGGRSSVPDITRQETQMWFYFLAGSYINIGCEAFHVGQVELIGMNDPDRSAWQKTLSMIRAYAKEHARRHWVLIDAHVPYHGMVKDGVSLLDFNSFPMRVKDVPEKPQQGILETGYLDALFNKSEGCVSPSGWKCEHLPYLVEFDNFGSDRNPGQPTLDNHFIWGYDEISWFSLQPEQYRNQWLVYATDWLRKNDPNGHLEMPGCRMITCKNETGGSYRANMPSEACPFGYGQEETIKMIWDKE